MIIIIHILLYMYIRIKGQGRRGRDQAYRSWKYNYLCNQCLSPIKLEVRTPFMARCTRDNIM